MIFVLAGVNHALAFTGKVIMQNRSIVMRIAMYVERDLANREVYKPKKHQYKETNPLPNQFPV